MSSKALDAIAQAIGATKPTIAIHKLIAKDPGNPGFGPGLPPNMRGIGGMVLALDPQ